MQRLVRKAHKILGIVVFIQLFFWMLSGLYMTAIPIEKVRGGHLATAPEPDHLRHQALPLVPLDTLLKNYPNATKISLTMRADKVSLVAVTTPEDIHYINGKTGEIAQLVSLEQARTIAQKAYINTAKIQRETLIQDPSTIPELGGRPGPIWQFSFDDWLDSTLYINANTGQLVAVRSALWRWFDFLWMLHIMDYDKRTNFNNPVVILMSSLGLFLTFSGILMIANGLQKKGLKFLK